jgi:hypothetical protein
LCRDNPPVRHGRGLAPHSRRVHPRGHADGAALESPRKRVDRGQRGPREAQREHQAGAEEEEWRSAEGEREE